MYCIRISYLRWARFFAHFLHQLQLLSVDQTSESCKYLQIVFDVVFGISHPAGQQQSKFQIISSRKSRWIKLCRDPWRTFSGVRRKFSWGRFIQWHRVVICILCALFVTSQFDVIVLFPNQRFSEVRWHNMHVFLNIHYPYFMCQCTEYNLLALQVRLSEENTPNATIHSS